MASAACYARKEPNSQLSQEGRGHLELPKQAKLAPLASVSVVHMKCAAVIQRRATESLCSLLDVLAGFNLSELQAAAV